MLTPTASGAFPTVSKARFIPTMVAMRRDPLGFVRRAMRDLGPTFVLDSPVGLVAPTFLLTTEPGVVREVLTNASTWTKRSPVYEEMAAALGDGLLTAEGDRWRAQRRTLQPMFTRRRVDAYASAFVEAAEKVVDGWGGGGIVDLDLEMQKVSLGSVSVTLFGTDVTDQVEPIIEATDLLSHHTVARGFRPVNVPKTWPTPLMRQIRAAEVDLERRVDAIVEEQARRRGIDLDAREGVEPDHDTVGDDFVTLLLTARDPETGRLLSRTEIREQALVMLLAGHDTTSTAMAFALLLLGRHPQVQESVREEAVALGDRAPTPDDLPALARTRRALDEAMRLYPPAYITSRVATEDTELAGVPVAGGTVAATSFWGLHRNTDTWDDPDRFDPDRFLPEAVKTRDSYAYLPFGGGPRSCIGNHFALLEATLGLAVVLRRFRIEAGDHEPATQLGITLRAAEPVFVRATPLG